MKISPHFSRKEFECSCGCGFDTVDVELVEILEDVRFHFNSPVTITSGCRCEAHNASVGGAKDSWHTKGRAADIKVNDAHPEDVYNYLETKHDAIGLGLYNTWVHVDSRGSKARWSK
jgi:uncharacterized protein YcbK (DUF882 family)